MNENFEHIFADLYDPQVQNIELYRILILLAEKHNSEDTEKFLKFLHLKTQMEQKQNEIVELLKTFK